MRIDKVVRMNTTHRKDSLDRMIDIDDIRLMGRRSNTVWADIIGSMYSIGVVSESRWGRLNRDHRYDR